ncbi:MAG: hypothetical protein QW568_01210 [Candidatus Anstonellaceae archaeon]
MSKLTTAIKTGSALAQQHPVLNKISAAVSGRTFDFVANASAIASIGSQKNKFSRTQRMLFSATHLLLEADFLGQADAELEHNAKHISDDLYGRLRKELDAELSKMGFFRSVINFISYSFRKFDLKEKGV